MNELKFGTLGETWINLVRLTLEAGVSLDKEGYECLGVNVSFPAANEGDPVIEAFGDPEMVVEMNRVFFTEAFNRLGHSYAKLMKGPDGRSDLKDIVDLLRAQPWSKRAVVTFCGSSDGKVPCINVVQFLVREQVLRTTYFSRGQDAYRKFYADGLCLGTMAQSVARDLGVRAGSVSGFISSSHIYHRDMPDIREFLARAPASLRSPGLEGVPS